MSLVDALHHALKNAKTVFACLSTTHSFKLQQPLII